jgi:hypothetical protein
MPILTKAMNEIALKDLVKQIKKLPRGSFISIKGYQSKNGEVADYLINHSPYYDKIMVNSANNVESEWKKVKCLQHDDLTDSEKWSVAFQFREDFLKRSESNEPEARFEVVTKGVQSHNGQIYLHGLIVGKKVIKVGTKKKERNYRSALTEYKDRLRKKLTVSRFRMFKLDRNFDEIVMGGMSLK